MRIQTAKQLVSAIKRYDVCLSMVGTETKFSDLLGEVKQYVTTPAYQYYGKRRIPSKLNCFPKEARDWLISLGKYKDITYPESWEKDLQGVIRSGVEAMKMQVTER